MIAGDLFESAMDCGMSSDLYWNSSPDEIHDYIASYHRRTVEAKKEEVSGWIHQAHLIGEASPMAAKTEATKPWDIFPELFKQEKKQFEKREFDNAMARRRQAAQAWNERRGLNNG